MEAPEEKRTPHSDITSFLILSNNHYAWKQVSNKRRLRLSNVQQRIPLTDGPDVQYDQLFNRNMSGLNSSAHPAWSVLCALRGPEHSLLKVRWECSLEKEIISNEGDAATLDHETYWNKFTIQTLDRVQIDQIEFRTDAPLATRVISPYRSLCIDKFKVTEPAAIEELKSYLPFKVEDSMNTIRLEDSRGVRYRCQTPMFFTRDDLFFVYNCLISLHQMPPTQFGAESSSFSLANLKPSQAFGSQVLKLFSSFYVSCMSIYGPTNRLQKKVSALQRGTTQKSLRQLLNVGGLANLVRKVCLDAYVLKEGLGDLMQQVLASDKRRYSKRTRPSKYISHVEKVMGYIDTLLELDQRLGILSWTSEQLKDSIFLEPSIWEIYKAIEMPMRLPALIEMNDFDNFLKKVTKKVHPLDTRIIDALFKRFPRSLLESTMLGDFKLEQSSNLTWMARNCYGANATDLVIQLLQEKYKKVIYLANGKLKVHDTPLSGGALVLNDRETLFWASDRLQLVTKSPSSADTTPVTKTITFPLNRLSVDRNLSNWIGYLPASEILCFAGLRSINWWFLYFDVNQLRQAEDGAKLSFKESIEFNSTNFACSV